MPRKSALPSIADQRRARGGAASVDRALSLLALFTVATPVLSLGDIAGRAGLYKSTALRLLASLEHARLVLRQTDGRWTLGAEIARLHRVHSASFSLEAVIMPVLRALVDETLESAAFYVRQGEQRLCLYRIDSPRPVRDNIRIGELLPLDRGASGRVLLAYAGASGPIYERIRREQTVALVADRVPELAGIAAPVFGADNGLIGVLTVISPAERHREEHIAPVRRAARHVTELLGGIYPEPEIPAA